MPTKYILLKDNNRFIFKGKMSDVDISKYAEEFQRTLNHKFERNGEGLFEDTAINAAFFGFIVGRQYKEL